MIFLWQKRTEEVRACKDNFERDKYISMNLQRNERSLLRQLRFGLLPLWIVTGDFVGKDATADCHLSGSCQVEDENILYFTVMYIYI